MTLTALGYRVLTTALSPLAGVWLRKRIASGKEDATRIAERYGRTKQLRPSGRLIWMHGASVGETLMLLPLIEGLLRRRPELNILVTSGTLTSAQLMEDRLPDQAVHQFAPLDTIANVRRFLDHWTPNLAIWAESEIWPNLVLETHRRKIPMALINARLSETSLLGWRKRNAFAKQIFNSFDIIRPADMRTASGLEDIIGSPVSAYGNLKDTLPAPHVDQTKVEDLRKAFGQRPIWVAASTHASEISIFAKAVRDIPDALMVWVPRHPETAAFIKAELTGLSIAQRSKGQSPSPKTRVYLFDTLGEMGTALSLAQVCVMGGSFSPELMGHNPLEPVRLGISTLTGPHVSSFDDTYNSFVTQDAIKVVEDNANLGEAVRDMLGDEDLRYEMRDRATKIASRSTNLLSETLDALEALL